MTPQAEMSGTRIPVVLRHRWIADLRFEVWTCHPLSVVLTPSLPDPICPGCRSLIDFDELPNRLQYGTPEELQLRLDLLHAETVTREARKQLEAIRRRRDAAA